MENFKIGDVVYLKSGSQPMTIAYLASDGKVHTIWHTKDSSPNNGVYPPETLTKDAPNKPQGKQF